MRIVRVDGVPAGEDAVGAATAIKDASLDGGKRAGDIFKGFCAAMSIMYIKGVAAREAHELGRALDPGVGRRRVLGVRDRVLLGVAPAFVTFA